MNKYILIVVELRELEKRRKGGERERERESRSHFN